MSLPLHMRFIPQRIGAKRLQRRRRCLAKGSVQFLDAGQVLAQLGSHGWAAALLSASSTFSLSGACACSLTISSPVAVFCAVSVITYSFPRLAIVPVRMALMPSRSPISRAIAGVTGVPSAYPDTSRSAAGAAGSQCPAPEIAPTGSPAPGSAWSQNRIPSVVHKVGQNDGVLRCHRAVVPLLSPIPVHREPGTSTKRTLQPAEHDQLRPAQRHSAPPRSFRLPQILRRGMRIAGAAACVPLAGALAVPLDPWEAWASTASRSCSTSSAV